MAFRLQETKEFEIEFNRIPKDIQRRFDKQFRKVEEDPYSIGRPLGSMWFRELKNEGYRVYYLVYDNKVIVLFVGVSNKKRQQEIIDSVKSNLPIFSELVE